MTESTKATRLFTARHDGLLVVGSVTLVFLPLKYENDDSVTVTVVLG